MPEPERSGVHLTGEDSGWPVATNDDTAEPEPKKHGTGGTDDDANPKAEAVADGEVITEDDAS